MFEDLLTSQLIKSKYNCNQNHRSLYGSTQLFHLCATFYFRNGTLKCNIPCDSPCLVKECTSQQLKIFWYFMMYWFMRAVALVVTLRGEAGLSETFQPTTFIPVSICKILVWEVWGNLRGTI